MDRPSTLARIRSPSDNPTTCHLERSVPMSIANRHAQSKDPYSRIGNQPICKSPGRTSREPAAWS